MTTGTDLSTKVPEGRRPKLQTTQVRRRSSLMRRERCTARCHVLPEVSS